jgi:hypothetical protein
MSISNYFSEAQFDLYNTPQTMVLIHLFLTELPEKYYVSDATFMINKSFQLPDTCQHHGFESKLKNMEIRMLLNVFLDN